MTENDTISSDANPARKPDFVAYSVRPRKDQRKSRWSEVGVAFRHKDGQGLDVLIDAVPLGGKLVLRTPESQG